MKRIEFTLTSGSSKTVYADTMNCLDKSDLREAVADWRAGRGRYVLLTGDLANEFFKWGRRMKSACGDWAWNRVILIPSLATIIGGISTWRSYSKAIDEINRLQDDEPEFLRCLCGKYTCLENGGIFVDLDKSSYVGAGFSGGRAPAPFWFGF